MQKTFTFQVNGEKRTVTTEPRRPLLEVLREEFHLTGTKYGCGEGDCRACTVLVDGKAIPSCLTRVEEVEGKRITTIEGLSDGTTLHPIQEAFLAEAGFQCGYCTPGMILGIVGLLNEKPKPTESEVLSRMERHLCRCCNYPRLAKAIRRAAHATV